MIALVKKGFGFLIHVKRSKGRFWKSKELVAEEYANRLDHPIHRALQKGDGTRDDKKKTTDASGEGQAGVTSNGSVVTTLSGGPHLGAASTESSAGGPARSKSTGPVDMDEVSSSDGEQDVLAESTGGKSVEPFLGNEEELGPCTVEDVKKVLTKITVRNRDKVGKYPIHAACANNVDLGVIQLLVQKWPKSLKAREKQFGKYPLHVLMENKKVKLDTVEYFIELYPKAARKKDNSGRLPLHIACTTKIPLSIIELLIDAYPEGVAEESGARGMLPVELACENKGSLQLIRLLVNKNPDCVDEEKTYKYGKTLLHIAATNHASFEVIQFLYEKCPSAISKQDTWGRIPLHREVSRPWSLETVQFLLDEHPDGIEVADNTGFLPLHLACKANPICPMDIIQLLIDYYEEGVKALGKSNETCLHQACMGGTATLELVKKLVEIYPDAIKITDKRGLTPVHISAAHSKGTDTQVAIVDFLTDQYPEKEQLKHTKKLTPLHHACANKPPLSIIKILVEKYPNTGKIRGKEGKTPLHLACEHLASFDVVEFLLEKFPTTIDVVDKWGQTPLHAACVKKANKDVIQILIKACPANLKVLDIKRLTPLHTLCSSTLRDPEAIQIVIDACPEALVIPRRDGAIPLHAATRGPHASAAAVRVLLDNYPEAYNYYNCNGNAPHDLKSSKEVKKFYKKYGRYRCIQLSLCCNFCCCHGKPVFSCCLPNVRWALLPISPHSELLKDLADEFEEERAEQVQEQTDKLLKEELENIQKEFSEYISAHEKEISKQVTHSFNSATTIVTESTSISEIVKKVVQDAEKTLQLIAEHAVAAAKKKHIEDEEKSDDDDSFSGFAMFDALYKDKAYAKGKNDIIASAEKVVRRAEELAAAADDALRGVQSMKYELLPVEEEEEDENADDDDAKSAADGSVSYSRNQDFTDGSYSNSPQRNRSAKFKMPKDDDSVSDYADDEDETNVSGKRAPFAPGERASAMQNSIVNKSDNGIYSDESDEDESDDSEMKAINFNQTMGSDDPEFKSTLRPGTPPKKNIKDLLAKSYNLDDDDDEDEDEDDDDYDEDATPSAWGKLRPATPPMKKRCSTVEELGEVEFTDSDDDEENGQDIRRTTKTSFQSIPRPKTPTSQDLVDGTSQPPGSPKFSTGLSSLSPAPTTPKKTAREIASSFSGAPHTPTPQQLVDGVSIDWTAIRKQKTFTAEELGVTDGSLGSSNLQNNVTGESSMAKDAAAARHNSKPEVVEEDSTQKLKYPTLADAEYDLELARAAREEYIASEVARLKRAAEEKQRKNDPSTQVKRLKQRWQESSEFSSGRGNEDEDDVNDISARSGSASSVHSDSSAARKRGVEDILSFLSQKLVTIKVEIANCKLPEESKKKKKLEKEADQIAAKIRAAGLLQQSFDISVPKAESSDSDDDSSSDRIGIV